MNVETVKKAVIKGEPAYFCDITNTAVLENLGTRNARGLVIVINDPRAVERTVKAARSISKTIHIVVRTNYLLDIAPLQKAGADDVIPAEREATAGLVKLVLDRCNVPPSMTEERVIRIRKKQQENGLV
jgi:CPA2 family monovalent cation:H+ antiporter-2